MRKVGGFLALLVGYIIWNVIGGILGLVVGVLVASILGVVVTSAFSSSSSDVGVSTPRKSLIPQKDPGEAPASSAAEFQEGAIQCAKCGKAIQDELPSRSPQYIDAFTVARAEARAFGILATLGYECRGCGASVCKGCMTMSGPDSCPKCGSSNTRHWSQNQ